MSNEHVIRRWFNEIWNKKQPSVISELLAPNGKAHVQGGELVGPAEFHDYYLQMTSAFPDIEVKLHEVISQGHAAAVRWSVSATHAGKGFDLEPTGRAVEFHGMTWVHIHDGMIVEGWDRWDLGGLVQQLSGPDEARG